MILSRVNNHVWCTRLHDLPVASQKSAQQTQVWRRPTPENNSHRPRPLPNRWSCCSPRSSCAAPVWTARIRRHLQDWSIATGFGHKQNTIHAEEWQCFWCADYWVQLSTRCTVRHWLHSCARNLCEWKNKQIRIRFSIRFFGQICTCQRGILTDWFYLFFFKLALKGKTVTKRFSTKEVKKCAT